MVIQKYIVEDTRTQETFFWAMVIPKYIVEATRAQETFSRKEQNSPNLDHVFCKLMVQVNLGLFAEGAKKYLNRSKSLVAVLDGSDFDSNTKYRPEMIHFLFSTLL